MEMRIRLTDKMTHVIWLSASLRILLILLLMLILMLMQMTLTGCAPFPKRDPRENADSVASESHFVKQKVKTSTLSFLTYQKITDKRLPIHVYIEGDGRSYLNKYKVSKDPTPHQPLALKLAVLDPHPNVVYLARPCQYISHAENPACTPEIWTTLRFSEPVISSMNEALTQIKQSKQMPQQKIELIGFSGGAAVAILLAARRQDVISLRTVAGDLDHEQMSQYHHTDPLDKRSLNPKDFVKKIQHLPQHHFAGEKDKIVPPMISFEWMDSMRKINSTCARRTVIKGAGHHRGFEAVWPELLLKPVDCEASAL